MGHGREIIDRLGARGIRAAYEAWGVEFTADHPSPSGYIECWAVNRPHGDKPNAGVDIASGSYRDLGKDGDSFGFFDFAAKHGGHGTWQAAQDHFAQQVGLERTPQAKARKPDENLVWEDWNDVIVGLWLRHKKGVTAEALQAHGARLARYYGQYTVVALPIWQPGTEKPCGWVMWNTTGGELPVFKKDSPTTGTKMKTTGGSVSGLMGPTGFLTRMNGRRVLKVEGPSDMLAAYALVPADQRDSVVIVTNSDGSTADPKPWELDAFKGLRVDVLHDADVAGEKGAVKWSEAIARVAAETRRAKLPYPIADSKGKDLRDWIAEGHGWPELLQLLDAGERIAAQPPKAIEAVDDPHGLARGFLSTRHAFEGRRTLVSWRDEWHQWHGRAYKRVPACDVKAELAAFVKAEFDRDNIEAQADRANWRGDKPPKAKQVTATLLNNVAQAIASYSLVSSDTEQPAWLSTHPENPAELLSAGNGLIHLSEETRLIPHTPEFFSANVLEFDFDSDATCPSWLAFLASVWGEDRESIEALQEYMGYCLMPDTRHHKMLMLVGPTRSGKGTIGRVLRRLVGPHNLCAPRLSDLANPFGLWPLAGKLVALVADARLSGRTDAVAVVESLLSITGDDPQDIHRKNLPTLTGVRLAARFVLMTNELPSLKDASGALMARVLLLRTTKAFAGKEDKTLDDRLAAELPGILNWAIAGWRRLRARGAFIQPETGKETVQAMADITSPISAFLRDACEVGPEFETPKAELYFQWKKWCESKGKQAGTDANFGKDLRAALPNLGDKQVRMKMGEKQVRVWHYTGVAGTGWHGCQSISTRGEKEEETTVTGTDTDDTHNVSSNEKRKLPVPPVPPVPAYQGEIQYEDEATTTTTTVTPLLFDPNEAFPRPATKPVEPARTRQTTPPLRQND